MTAEADSEITAEICRESSTIERLAVEVAGGQTIRGAAAELGISERTAYGISPTMEFRNRVSEIRTEIASVAVGKLTAAAGQAVDTLLELIAATNEPKTRVDACKLILASLGPLAEHCEFRQRLDRLESGK